MVIDERAVARVETFGQGHGHSRQILARRPALPAVGAGPHALALIPRQVDSAGLQQVSEESFGGFAFEAVDVLDQVFELDWVYVGPELGGGVQFVDVMQ